MVSYTILWATHARTELLRTHARTQAWATLARTHVWTHARSHACMSHARTHARMSHARTHGVTPHARTHGVTPHARTHAGMSHARTHAWATHACTHEPRTHARMSHARTHEPLTHGVTPHARTHAYDVVRFILPYKYVYIVPNFHSAVMAHRVQVFSRELNAFNDVKHDKQKYNRIIDEGGMELVHCICDCVHNISQGNIPVTEEEKETLKRHKEYLRKLVKKKTSDREKKHLIQEGGFLGALIPTLVGLVGKLFTGEWCMNIRRNYRWNGVERSACEYPNCNICYYYKTLGD